MEVQLLCVAEHNLSVDSLVDIRISPVALFAMQNHNAAIRMCLAGETLKLNARLVVVLTQQLDYILCSIVVVHDTEPGCRDIETHWR